MKPYRDIFGNKLTKKDVMLACQVITEGDTPYTAYLQRKTKWGYGKANRHMVLLSDAGVITDMSEPKRYVILKDVDQAVNAALRQLKKGKK